MKKLKGTFLNSKVARRIFLLFVFCALLPISLLAGVSFTQVTAQLNSQGLRRLHHSAKAMGMSIMERLSFIEQELKVISRRMSLLPGSSPAALAEPQGKDVRKRLLALAFTKDFQEARTLFGHAAYVVEPSEAEKNHLRSGKALVFTPPLQRDRRLVYMVRAVDPQDLALGVLFAHINPLYLWGLSESDTLPAGTELCVLNASNQVIYATHAVPGRFLEDPSFFEKTRFTITRFEWALEGKKYLASFWPVFMKFQYVCPKWTVIMSASKEDIEAPLALFKKIFPLVIFASLMLVLLLSVIQIRKTMHPLEMLKQGTRLIANRDFSSRVKIASEDEFEELGDAFNEMGRHLGRQFEAMTTVSEIDRAVLSALDTEQIAFTAVEHIHEFFGYEFMSISLFQSGKEQPTQTYMARGTPTVIRLMDQFQIPWKNLETFMGDRDLAILRTGSNFPDYLRPFAGGQVQTLILLPLMIKQNFSGVIIMGIRESAPPPREDLNQARQLADQVAVALSNAKLLDDLDQLNWGTLTALARAVDAKSPWTAGHSERVTNLALKIGRAMGLSAREMEDLHRGGLLHDIGKIGTPVGILDKPGRLTEEEMRVIQEHPGLGARILEPIEAYDKVIPLVLQHHERFDGGGYPQGLAGEDINYGARILAVADVYDALVSDRPYRKGMAADRVKDILQKNSGTHFDPPVVEAFLDMISARGATPAKNIKPHQG